ncbi:hypothetical protein QBC46DRAFT_409452 [Diplogelasinospora grovesii]|uniref:Uncharacterized protein n=1 Tax=Diplogelasinospora grovesii TaxID=303347 RepID=A0AAN6N4T8_9PEZI|nr:hypothetical protein QBC46DRAFT_409452 [Diplogelasinospora grovesii]
MGCSSSKDADNSDSPEERKRNVQGFLAHGVHGVDERTKIALGMSGIMIHDNGQSEAPLNSAPSAHQVQQPRRPQGQQQQIELYEHTRRPQVQQPRRPQVQQPRRPQVQQQQLPGLTIQQRYVFTLQRARLFPEETAQETRDTTSQEARERANQRARNRSGQSRQRQRPQWQHQRLCESTPQQRNEMLDGLTRQQRPQDQGPSGNAAPPVPASQINAPRHAGVSSRSGPSPTYSQVIAPARQQAARPRVQQPSEPQLQQPQPYKRLTKQQVERWYKRALRRAEDGSGQSQQQQPPQSQHQRLCESTPQQRDELPDGLTLQQRSQDRGPSGNAAPPAPASQINALQHVGVSSRSGPSPAHSQVPASTRQLPAPPAHTRPTGSSTGTSSNSTRTRARSLRVATEVIPPPAPSPPDISPISETDLDYRILPDHENFLPEELPTTNQIKSAPDRRGGVPKRNVGRPQKRSERKVDCGPRWN